MLGHGTDGKSWMILACISIHMLWGVLALTTSDSVTWVTSIASMQRTFPNRFFLGGFCMVAGSLALIGLHRKFRYKTLGLLLMLPQQYLLIESLLGAVKAISQSSFADGVIRPREFIGADQGVYIILGVFHTIAIIDYHLHHILSLLSLKFKKEI